MKELYTISTFNVGQLVDKISTGELGLPDLQRPFVWKNTRVRDLFDSLLKGFPIGYLMLWDCPSKEDNRSISMGEKSYTSPKEVIIDGQQRLTSLYAVIKGQPVINDKFEKVQIKIAYHPIEDKFEVCTSAIEKDPEWISNISDIFNTPNMFTFTSEYISRLQKSKEDKGEEFSSEQANQVYERINEITKIKDRHLPVFNIFNDVDEEIVSEIFVRVNSRGITLKQNDFILTLMSIYWGEGRDMIESFCQSSHHPVYKKSTAYNPITEVTPQNIIRVVLAFGFNRGRLKYGYKLLRGADLENKGAVDEKLKTERFDHLKEVLPLVLDLTNWHEFIKSVMNAGYLSGEMILSQNALFYSYAFYLIGKYRFKIPEMENQNLCSLWFFYATLSSLYAGSFESVVEEQLNRIKNLKTIEEYKGFLLNRISERLTDDYFKITLPGTGVGGLEVSGGGNNAWFAYVAALNLLGTPVLFTRNNLLVSTLFQAGVDGKKKSLEKHHLFPKACLKSLGYGDNMINQMANYALIDWKQNISILDAAPSDYYPIVCEGMSEEVIRKMEDENALPHGWENMDYPKFLAARRKLMADRIKEAYQKLLNNC